MSNEITTEVLAKAVDETKEIVRTKENTVSLVIQNKDVDFQIINKAASNRGSQLNAMIIAQIINDKPDYNNGAVVSIGTNLKMRLYEWFWNRIIV